MFRFHWLHRASVLAIIAGSIATLSPTSVSHASESEQTDAEKSSRLAADVKELLRSRCSQCHGNDQQIADLNVLSLESLLADDQVVPGDASNSRLYEILIEEDEDTRMPKGAPPLSEKELALVRHWIEADAPAFPADIEQPVEEDRDDSLNGLVGVDYVLKQILAHQRTLPVEKRVRMRYFSCNHLIAGGATREQIDLQRKALAKAANHLSYQPRIAPLTVVDGETATVFAYDLRDLGWHVQPYRNATKSANRAEYNLFDLVLLEYPYSIAYEASETYDRLAMEYMHPAGMVRPIPYVRVDWFCSTALQPALYNDLMRLPLHLNELEKQIGVDSQANVRDGIAQRGAVAVSGVSHNNRAMERHPSNHGSYWKSIDYASSKGRDNLFADPINLHGAGGEMIFSLPNGLQAYYLATGDGLRLDSAPTTIVTDKFSEDKNVRNGLSCIRCHDRGMKPFRDDVRASVIDLPGSYGFDKRKVAELYPTKETMDELIEEDRIRFLTAMKKVNDDDSDNETLAPVSRRFLDAPIAYHTAVGELGLQSENSFEGMFRSPQFAGAGLVPLSNNGVIRRDMWEDYFPSIVEFLGLGVPVIPVDAVTRPDFRVDGSNISVALSTSHTNNLYSPGDDLVIFAKNEGQTTVYVEMIGTGVGGEKVVLVPAGKTLSPGETLRFPETGSLKVQSTLGNERITLFASLDEFEGGQVLSAKNMADRFVHPFYKLNVHGAVAQLDHKANRIEKQTLTIETR
ncbi:serine/threonine-protein kinase [Rhodopirellula rubra]|uniref:Serine/threonine-protein kinase n=1 Tax=Aporhodopirellula rubra TaxID=980271 RepID=A0A7W5E3H3_9BACT|nr:c-type cytochrome domain-containing protein [Aporhodopirellula rubra]MBB3208637.1 serine/threonine-protein kinase [Aporhodopirellula rubra]